MIYHFCVMSPYITKYIDFLKMNKKHFDLKNHFFIINDFGSFKSNIDLLKDINHVVVKKKIWFGSQLKNMSESDKLIIHGLFSPYLLLYLFIQKRILQRCIWSIWGGDVYFYKNKNDSFKKRFIEYLRKFIIPRIPAITALVKGDYEILRKVYRIKAQYIYSFYPVPIEITLTDNLRNDEHKNMNIKTIMVGNSGDPSNNHMDVFEKLEKFKDNNVKIFCPLSYGNDEYINELIIYGEKLFNNNFIPLRRFVPPAEYLNILNNVDVAIMNQNRQQGLGSIINLLALGKKVFIRSDTTSFQFFEENGITVFSSQCIGNLSLSDFLYYEKNTAKENRKKIENIFSNQEAVNSWKNVFNIGLIGR